MQPLNNNDASAVVVVLTQFVKIHQNVRLFFASAFGGYCGGCSAGFQANVYTDCALLLPWPLLHCILLHDGLCMGWLLPTM